jgi:hypothetical protein
MASTHVTGVNDTDVTHSVKKQGDTKNRLELRADGSLAWGPGGSTAPDTFLSRTGPGVLSLTAPAQQSFLPPAPSGSFLQRRGVDSALTLTNNNANWILWLLPPGTIIVKIGVGYSVAGSAGSVVRHALYAATTAGWPGTLLQDAGTQDMTIAANDTEANSMIACNTTVPTDGRLWTMHVGQGAPSTNPTVRAYTGGDALALPSHPGASSRNNLTSTVTGAAPATAPASTSYGLGTSPMRSILKVA